MKYFKKLSLSIDTSCALDTTKLSFGDSFYKWQKYGLNLLKQMKYTAVANKQYKIIGKDADDILAYLPKSLLYLEVPEVWVFNSQSNDAKLSMLAPHRDLVRLCGINIYYETHSERTIFYTYDNQVLSEVESFVAKNGDCYILDVDQPHSVELTPNKIRKSLSISFINTPYSEVIKHF